MLDDVGPFGKVVWRRRREGGDQYAQIRLIAALRRMPERRRWEAGKGV